MPLSAPSLDHVDLSGLIFVVLAVAWAGYLIPRALRHHEEVAANRPVDSFSDTMRVLERTPATMKALLTPPASTVVEEARVAHAVVEEGPLGARLETAAASARPASRSSARGAARRRRRVLGLLLFATATTAGVAAFAYISWVSVAVPGLLVLGWLVLCRLMVRKTSLARRRHPVVEEGTLGAGLETPGPATVVAEGGPEKTPAEPVVLDPVAELEDDGSLWDPLPLTLPTYVSKPAARRTVRTIDLTQTDVTSSGHRAEDTQIARAAEADARAANATQTDSGEGQQRRAAGA